jgi:hypothetical protein
MLLQDHTRNPVWLQLLKSVADYDGGAQIVGNLGQQLADQLTLTTQLQRQLTDGRQQNAAQQQVIADQAAQLQALQQVPAEQSNQIAALQAQLFQQNVNSGT